MRLEHHLVGGYVRYVSPHIIIIIINNVVHIGVSLNHHTLCMGNLVWFPIAASDSHVHWLAKRKI